MAASAHNLDPEEPPLWLWVNILSMDAPAVAIAWAALFARSRGVALPATNILTLALIVWLIYLADRILDGWHADKATLQERHRFSERHRSTLLCVLALGALFAAWLVREDLSGPEIKAGFLLAGLVSMYMLCVHFRGELFHRFLPKEVAVGLLFAAGTMLPVWSRATVFSAATLRITMIRWVLFGLLCSLNCLAIECWEKAGSAESNHEKLPSAAVAWSEERLSGLAFALAALCGLARLLFPAPAVAIPAITVGLAALLTLLLNATRHRLSAPALRVLADVALLLPALAALLHLY